MPALSASKIAAATGISKPSVERALRSLNPFSAHIWYTSQIPVPERSPTLISANILKILPFRASLIPPAIASSIPIRNVPGFAITILRAENGFKEPSYVETVDPDRIVLTLQMDPYDNGDDGNDGNDGNDGRKEISP